MKINEVEALVGITKKNIRFYEEQGLLSPRRNSENGYRDYGQEEVDTLRQIKLLRKLGVPLEEIRRMQAGRITVADGMRRHLVTLEREQRSLEQSMELCRCLKNREERLAELDAGSLLAEMEQMEQAGSTFQDKQYGDVKPIRYAAAVIAALVMTAFMAGVIALMVWGFTVEAAEAPPLPLIVVLVALPAVVILGVLLALIQRIREIQRGEEDDAKNYSGKRLPGCCAGHDHCGGPDVPAHWRPIDRLLRRGYRALCHRRRSVFCPAVFGGGSRRDHLFVPPLERDPRG